MLLVFNLTLYSQEDNISEWKSQVFIDLNASNRSSYEYYDVDNKAQKISINGKGPLELAYNIDYKIFRRISAVAIASVTNYNSPSFVSIKSGLGMKLLYVDHK